MADELHPSALRALATVAAERGPVTEFERRQLLGHLRLVCQAAARGDLMGLGVCRIGIELHGRISAAGVREVLAEAIRCDCTPKDPENITAMLGALK